MVQKFNRGRVSKRVAIQKRLQAKRIRAGYGVVTCQTPYGSYLKRKQQQLVNAKEQKLNNQLLLNSSQRELLVKVLTPLLTPESKATKKTKPGWEVGRVVIVLEGKHAGRRVVLVKVLESGNAVATGPYALNKVGLFVVRPQMTINTSVKLDLSGLEVPENVNAAMFKKTRVRTNKGEKTEGSDLFSKPTFVTVTPDLAPRKQAQAVIDKAVFKAISQHDDSKILLAYLHSFFSLSANSKPHSMKF